MPLLRRRSQSEHGLMHTPHPGLPPIEMASAGILVVTNTFENKTSERPRSISRNLTVAEVERYERRIAGSQVDWPTTGLLFWTTSSWRRRPGFWSGQASGP